MDKKILGFFRKQKSWENASIHSKNTTYQAMFIGTKDTGVNKIDKRPSANGSFMRQIVNKYKLLSR